MFEESLIKRLMRGLQYSIPTAPRPKVLFSLTQIKDLCHSFESTLTLQSSFSYGVLWTLLHF